MANGQPVSFSTTFGRAEVNGIRMYYRMAGSGEPVGPPAWFSRDIERLAQGDAWIGSPLHRARTRPSWLR